MACLLEWYGAHRDLHVRTHSFPARRSSDLGAADDRVAAGAQLPDPPEWQAGEDCDGYTLLRPLHIGGRSHVWLARDTATGAAVAIKDRKSTRLNSRH